MKYSIIAFFLAFGISVHAENNIDPVIKNIGELVSATYFHDNGNIHQKGFFNKKGQLEGLLISYDFDGNKLSQGYYSNGEKTGQWMFWNQSSLKEVYFIDSKIVNINEWEQKSDIALNTQ